MAQPNITTSDQTLVTNSVDSVSNKSVRTLQYLAGIGSTLGALAAGMMLAWSSPAGDGGKYLKDAGYDFEMTKIEWSLVGGLSPLGAAFICIPIGILVNMIGRKMSMLLLVIPFTIGWLCIIFANSLVLLYIGRFIVGLSGGAFCVTAPMYTSEIAESEIRGSLGSYFQLLLTVGILLTYILGTYVNMFVLSIISAIVPWIFFAVFFFMPETPYYYLTTSNEEAARTSLQKFRGPNYNIDTEIRDLKESIAKAENEKVSFFEAIKSRAAVKGLIIAFSLMLFQQLSGVNAIIFYQKTIFEKSKTTLDSNLLTIIVGIVQVVGVFLSTLIVDRAGRKILLIGSGIVMFLTDLVLGVYFKLSEDENEVINSIGMLPVICVGIFIFSFSIGFGPIPWMMMAEIFAPSIKGIAASSACTFNWLMAFVVTFFFDSLQDAFNPSGTFWIFSGISLISTFFIFFIVPETKGKSFEQIQLALGG